MEHNAPPVLPKELDETTVLHAFVSAVLHGIILIGIYVALVVNVPRFEKIFDSFQTSLPSLTVLVIDVANWCKNYFVVAAPLIMLAIVGYGAVYYLLRRKAHSAWHILWSGAWYAAMLVLIMLVVQAMFLPLFQLMHSVGNNAGN